jgi:hypothetical protein
VKGTAPTSFHEFLFDALSHVLSKAFSKANLESGQTPPYTINPNVNVSKDIMIPLV